MVKYFIPILIVAVSVGFILTGFVGADRIENRPMIHLKVDEFQTKDDWMVTYSRWRSPHFGYVNQALDMEPEPAYEWFDVFSCGDEFPCDKVLPEFALRDVRERVQTFLAVRARFDYQANNWFAIEPAYSRLAGKRMNEPNIPIEEEDLVEYFDPTDLRTNKPMDGSTTVVERPYFIRLSGRTKTLELWIWSNGKDYTLEAHVEDFRGVTHIIPGASLKYRGWQKIRIDIPEYIRQSHYEIPERRPLKFLRLKVFGNADTNYGPAQWYFYWFTAWSDPLLDHYDGQYLEHHSDDLWDAR